MSPSDPADGRQHGTGPWRLWHKLYDAYTPDGTAGKERDAKSAPSTETSASPLTPGVTTMPLRADNPNESRKYGDINPEIRFTVDRCAHQTSSSRDLCASTPVFEAASEVREMTPPRPLSRSKKSTMKRAYRKPTKAMETPRTSSKRALRKLDQRRSRSAAMMAKTLGLLPSSHEAAPEQPTSRPNMRPGDILAMQSSASASTLADEGTSTTTTRPPRIKRDSTTSSKPKRKRTPLQDTTEHEITKAHGSAPPTPAQRPSKRRRRQHTSDDPSTPSPPLSPNSLCTEQIMRENTLENIRLTEAWTVMRQSMGPLAGGRVEREKGFSLEDREEVGGEAEVDADEAGRGGKHVRWGEVTFAE